ncbi:hypothetical protein B9T25_14165 [Acinetobacter sp. ANC 4470]|nr:hypothetical protein B9T25_14165 [Acinetobacter sp. ANC 4470]
MLAVVHKGIAIPIFWMLLDKRGNSNTNERIEIIQRFICIFGKSRITQVLADREFIGKEWLSWLDQQNIQFCIRIKKNAKVSNSEGRIVQIHELFRDLKPNQVVRHSRALNVDGVCVHVWASKLKDELMLVASNTQAIDAIASYKKRWEIETLFGCLKSRGFNLEDTHLTDQDKFSKLLAVYSIAFCWAYRMGIWHHDEIKPIKVKKHGRFENSLFRLGFDLIVEGLKYALFHQDDSKILNIIDQLRCCNRLLKSKYDFCRVQRLII